VNTAMNLRVPLNARSFFFEELNICWLLKECFSVEDNSVYFTKVPLISHKNTLRNDGGEIYFLSRTVPLYMLRLLSAVLH
jgi:hypothetical protein